MLRKILYFPLLILTLSLAYLLSWIPIIKQSYLFKSLVRILMKLILSFLGVSVRIDIEKSYPFPKRYIIVANHVSALDGMILLIHFPKAYIVSDTQHRRIPILGRLIKLINNVGLDRTSPYSRISSIESMINEVNTGNTLIIFPQGETSDKVERFTLGAFIVAKKTLTPIVPVFLAFNSLQEFYFSPPWSYIESYKNITRAIDKTVHLRILPSVSPLQYDTPQDLCYALVSEYKNCYKMHQDAALS